MNTWTATAFNTAPDSENQIHGDDLAKEYGFEGGLVPGVTISAYLVHPLIELWGQDWLDSGFANCRITSPLYDNEEFTVETDQVQENKANTILKRSNGVISANAEVSIPEKPLTPPKLRGNNIVSDEFVAQPATKEVWQSLKSNGCLAFKFKWDSLDPLIYLRDEELLPELLRPKGRGYSNLCFLLGCSNWILAGNAYMNPWVHLQTISQNFRAVELNTELIAEMEINKIYEKKGHEFIDVFVNLFDETDESCVMSINLIAIYKMRGSK